MGDVVVRPDGKVEIPVDQFQEVFAQIIAGQPIPETHADPPETFGNPVTPGVGSLVIDATTWAKRWASHAKNASTDWFERTLTPSGNPIDNAIAANDKRKDRLKAAEDSEKWLKTMKRRTFADVVEGVEAVKAAGYEAGLTKSERKAARRFTELQPLVETLKKTIMALPEGTKQERGAKMLAARDGMLAIGDKLRG